MFAHFAANALLNESTNPAGGLASGADSAGSLSKSKINGGSCRVMPFADSVQLGAEYVSKNAL